MRVAKKLGICVLSTLVFVFTLSPLQGHSFDLSPTIAATKTASTEAVRRFGVQSSVSFITTFHDLEGNPAVYLFLVIKNQDSIPENLKQSVQEGINLLREGQSLIQTGRNEEGQKLIARGKTLILQEDTYGTLLVSAKPERPSLIAFHHGLPTYLTARTEAEERAEAFSGGKPVAMLGVLYFSPFEYYFEFKVEGRHILVSPFDSEVFDRAVLESDIEPSEPPVFESPDEGVADRTQRDLDDRTKENDTEASRLYEFPDSLMIAGVPDYNQRFSLSNSCGPTAGASLLGYWDAQGYENFLQGAGTYDDVTQLIEELCDTMSWNPTFGVYYTHIPIGLQAVNDDRGYEMGISTLYAISSLDTIRLEILEGRPFVYGSQENPWGVPHYVVVVGYQGNFIIVHDNWPTTPVDYFVNWNALGHTDDMITTLIPQGQVGPASQPLPSGYGGSGGGCFISAVLSESETGSLVRF